MTATPNYSFPRSFTSLKHINSRRFLTIQPATRVLALNNTLNPTNNTLQITPRDSINSPPLWTVSEISEAVNGRILKWGPPGTISTDTRTLEPGQWFFAIDGENFDAHDFVTPDLADEGCAGVIGNRVCENWDKGFVKIDGDTLISLEKMANYARNRFHGCLVGVTGSVGKTTTRTMIALALESLGPIYQTRGNQNNRIGVALSLIGIPGDNMRIAVLELGMSGKGEILELARMAQPSIRVVLNVGASHLENFASIEEVAMAKGEILVEARPGDVCVLNADDPLVMSLPVPIGVREVLFGRRFGCDVRLVVAESIDGGLGVKVVLENNKEMVEFVIHSPGLHLAVNACAAAAIAILLGVSLSQVGISLSRFVPTHMRSELEVARNGILIINDVYNANPVSTKAAIDLLKGIDCKGKRVAILGDMLELGPTEIESHEMILGHCCDACIDIVALVGKRFLTAAENSRLIERMNVIHASDAEIIVLQIVTKLSSDDVVLVKGSRAMQMERVVEAIKAMDVRIFF
ncbi:hypothetical protein L1049_022237 [Liquidambar formosana]|uniref:UDP-MurNAc-pentapeptide synthetase n=1 Tax=Liquidambar formosana TaxID=63359 RepID=A0AAP0RC53_LIQFO